MDFSALFTLLNNFVKSFYPFRVTPNFYSKLFINHEEHKVIIILAEDILNRPFKMHVVNIDLNNFTIQYSARIPAELQTVLDENIKKKLADSINIDQQKK